MNFFWKFLLLVGILCSSVLSEEVALVHGLARRQIFSSIPIICTEATCLTTTISTTSSSSSSASSTPTTSSSSTSTTSSSPSPSSTISTVSSTTSSTSTASYDQYAVTTTFTQPPSCTDGFTAIDNFGTEIYNNLIYSQSGFDIEYATCYPPQFYSSVLALISSTMLGPFTALICPNTWESYDVNSTYVICCPKGYSLVAPNFDDTNRPGAGAVCSSSIGASALLDITSFDSTGGETVVPATAGGNGTYVWANAFDGITTSVSTPPTSSSTSITTTMSSTSSSSSSTSGATSSSSSSSSSSTSGSTLTSSSSSTTTSTYTSIPTSTTISTTSSTTSSYSSPTTTTGTAIPGESSLPACGQLCFNNLLAQYSSLGCAPLDSYCLCNNVNFGYGLRDCSNGACGTDVASTVIAFGSSYCATASSTHIPASTAIPGESALPSCGQVCFNNMLAQYSTLGCAPLDSYCLCSNVNFGYGLRDCSNGACGTAVASTVIAFGSAYCSTAIATHTVQATLVTKRAVL